MPAPANIRNRFGQMLDAAWDARAAGLPFRDVDVFVVQGRQVIMRMDFDPPTPPTQYERITSWLKWPPP